MDKKNFIKKNYRKKLNFLKIIYKVIISPIDEEKFIENFQYLRKKFNGKNK